MKEKVVDKRRIKLGEIEKTIPLFCGRPDRKKTITQDEVTNLTIDLHSIATVDEFIERM